MCHLIAYFFGIYQLTSSAFVSIHIQKQYPWQSNMVVIIKNVSAVIYRGIIGTRFTEQYVDGLMQESHDFSTLGVWPSAWRW